MYIDVYTYIDVCTYMIDDTHTSRDVGITTGVQIGFHLRVGSAPAHSKEHERGIGEESQEGDWGKGKLHGDAGRYINI
jgi:hypothetical protein